MNLVTGATGIVGSHIVVELLKRKEPIRILLRSTSNTNALDKLLRFHQLSDRKSEIEQFTGDINDPITLLEATKGCDCVYHAAALVSFRKKDHDNLFMVNTAGTGHIVDACLENQVPELVYLSSTAAIGDEKINGEFTEQSAWTSDKGRSGYSLSKRHAEMAVWRGVQEGLKTIIVNPGIIIGPGQWGQSSTTMISSCERGMRFYPAGSNGFVDARDVVKAIFFLKENERWNERFLLIGESLAFKDFFTEVCRQLETTPPKTLLNKSLVSPVIKLLQGLEFIGANPFKLSSENLLSAYRESSYSSKKIKDAGFEFKSAREAVEYTLSVRKSGV